MAEPFLDGKALRIRLFVSWSFSHQYRGHVRELAHVLNKNKASPAHVNFVARRQLPFTLQGVAVDARAVEAVEIAHAPAAVGMIDLGMFAAAEIVLQDDAVG